MVNGRICQVQVLGGVKRFSTWFVSAARISNPHLNCGLKGKTGNIQTEISIIPCKQYLMRLAGFGSGGIPLDRIPWIHDNSKYSELSEYSKYSEYAEYSEYPEDPSTVSRMSRTPRSLHLLLVIWVLRIPWTPQARRLLRVPRVLNPIGPKRGL